MSSAKTGGNKKSASPSDQRYQQRRKMGNLDQVHKDAAHSRHNARMGLDFKYAQNLTTAGGKPHPIRHAEKPGKGSLFSRPILPKGEALAILRRAAQEAAEIRQGMRAVLSGD